MAWFCRLSKISQDKRQAILAAWACNSVRWRERIDLEQDDGGGHVRRDFPDLHVGHLDACRPEERRMIGGMARDDGQLARPMHADDVDPMRVIDKEFGQRLHVVSVPGSQ